MMETPSSSLSGTSTPRSKLDSLPKEELIRFVKKQVQSLQLSRQKCQTLEKKLSALETSKSDFSSTHEDDISQLQAQNEKLLEQVKIVPKLQADIKEASNAKESAEASLAELSAEKSRVEDMCNSLEEMTASLSKQISSLQSESEAAVKAKLSAESEAAKLKSQMKKFKDEIKLLKNNLKESQKGFDNAEKDRNEAESLKTELDVHKNEIEKLRSQLSANQEWETKCAELSQKLETTAQILEKEKESREEIERKMEELRNSLEGKAEVAEEEGEIAKNAVKEMQRRAEEELRMMREGWEKKEEEWAGIKKEMAEALENEKKRAEEMESALEEAQQQNEETTLLKNRALELENEVSNLQNQLAVDREEINRLEKALSEAKDQRKELEENVGATASCLKETELENEALLSTVQDLKTRIQSLQDGSTESVLECDKLREEKDALEAEIRDKEKSLTEMKVMLDDEAAQKDANDREMREGLAKIEEERKKYANEVECLKKQNEETTLSKNRASELENEVSNLQNQLAVDREEINLLEKALCEAKQQNEETTLSKNRALELENEVSNLQSELAVHREEINRLEKALSEAKSSTEERASLREEFLEKEKRNLEMGVESEQRKNDSLTARLEVLTETSRNSELLKTDNENLQRQLKNVKKEEAALKKSLSDAIDEVVELKGKLEAMKVAEVEPPKCEEKSFQTDPEPTDTSAQEMEQELSNCRKKLGTLSSTVSELKEELNDNRKTQEQQKLWADKLALELDQKKGELVKLREESEHYRNQLQNFKQNVSEQSVLNLEMADYQRSLQKMQEEVTQLKTLMDSKTKENESLQKEIDATRMQKSKIDTTVTKYKAVLVRTKKELAEWKEKVDERETELSEVKSKLHLVSEELETMKLEMSTNMAGGQQRLHSLEAAVSSLQRQLSKSQTQRDSMQKELESVKDEYDTYKVRVHSVLKQQHTKSEVDEELVEEKNKLSKMVDDLQQKLSETNTMCITAREELVSLQEENERLSQRLRDIQTEASETESNLKLQLDAAKKESTQLTNGHKETIKQLTEQTEKIRLENQGKIDQLDADYSKKVNHLQDVINSLETQVSELKTVEKLLPNGDHHVIRKSPSYGGDGNVSDENLPPPFSERKPGEGSENMETLPQPAHVHHSHRGYYGSEEPISSPKFGDYPMSPVMPLEDLLTSDRLSVSSFTTMSEAQDVTATKLEKSLRRIQHLNEVLHESEGTNARLTEQTKLLKEEIRRLERNTEREQHVANSEYLKNIFMKFLTPQVDDERAHLIPVLKTMLRLSPEEVAHLNAMAKGEDQAAAASTSGWSNYLHRWSGMT